MSYKRGDLKRVERCDEPDEFGDCSEFIDSHEKVHDSRGAEVDGPVAYLPHSCDKWVIGGKAEIRELIEDLQEALREMEEE